MSLFSDRIYVARNSHLVECRATDSLDVISSLEEPRYRSHWKACNISDDYICLSAHQINRQLQHSDPHPEYHLPVIHRETHQIRYTVDSPHTSFVFPVFRVNQFRFASGSADRSLKIWDSEELKCVTTIVPPKDDASPLYAGCVIPWNPSVCIGGGARPYLILVFDLVKGVVSQHFRFHERNLLILRAQKCLDPGLFVSAQQESMYSTNDNHSVVLWDLRSRDHVASLSLEGIPAAAEFLEMNSLIVRDNTGALRLFDLRDMSSSVIQKFGTGGVYGEIRQVSQDQVIMVTNAAALGFSRIRVRDCKILANQTGVGTAGYGFCLSPPVLLDDGKSREEEQERIAYMMTQLSTSWLRICFGAFSLFCPACWRPEF